METTSEVEISSSKLLLQPQMSFGYRTKTLLTLPLEIRKHPFEFRSYMLDLIHPGFYQEQCGEQD